MTKELARRIAFTIGALLIFRLSLHIPLPGLAPPISDEVPRQHPSFLIRLLSGPNLAPIGVLALTPYISAAVIIQLVSMVWRRLGSLEQSGEVGRGRIARYTLILTLLFAIAQAFGVAASLRQAGGMVDNPDHWFVLSATASMVGGVFFLIWLSELITLYGIGNGLALILSVGVLISLPREIAGVIDQVQGGALSANVVLFHTVFWVAVVALIVFVESARRNVLIEFAERTVGERVLPPQSAVLPIKINSAGLLVPVTMSSWVWLLPLGFAGVIFGENAPWLAAAYHHMGVGRPAHIIVGSIAIFVLVLVYASYVLDPEHTAESLGKRGGAIPGVEPGEATADYLDRTVSLTTVLGAAYLTALLLIPELLAARSGMPYYIGSGSVLIVVCTILDIQKQVRDVSLTNRGGGRR